MEEANSIAIELNKGMNFRQVSLNRSIVDKNHVLNFFWSLTGFSLVSDWFLTGF